MSVDRLLNRQTPRSSGDLSASARLFPGGRTNSALDGTEQRFVVAGGDEVMHVVGNLQDVGGSRLRARNENLVSIQGPVEPNREIPRTARCIDASSTAF